MGVLIVLVGIALTYWGVWMPLEQARAGAESITLHGGMKLALMVPMCFVFGVGYVTGGESFHHRMQNTTRTRCAVGARPPRSAGC